MTNDLEAENIRLVETVASLAADLAGLRHRLSFLEEDNLLLEEQNAGLAGAARRITTLVPMVPPHEHQCGPLPGQLLQWDNK